MSTYSLRGFFHYETTSRFSSFCLLYLEQTFMGCLLGATHYMRFSSECCFIQLNFANPKLYFLGLWAWVFCFGVFNNFGLVSKMYAMTNNITFLFFLNFSACLLPPPCLTTSLSSPQGLLSPSIQGRLHQPATSGFLCPPNTHFLSVHCQFYHLWDHSPLIIDSTLLLCPFLAVGCQ